MYLQYLLQEDDDSLLHKVYTAQAEHPVRGDWVEQVKKDMNCIGYCYEGHKWIY